MHIHIVLCAAAILTVTQSTPIAVARKNVEDEGIINNKIATRVQNPADFDAVKMSRSKRQTYRIPDPPVIINGFQSPVVDPFQSSNPNSHLFDSQQHIKYPSIPGSSTYLQNGGLTHQFDSQTYLHLRPSVGNNGYGGSATLQRTFGGDSSGDGCLYGEDFVLLQDGSRKQLKNLRSGDKVYSIDKQGKLVKDEMIMMLHGGPKVEAQFHMLTTSWNRTISLTPHHLIMKYSPQEKRSQMVAANELKAGDYLLMSDKQQIEAVPITSIEVFNKTGIYTPMTYKGTLFVNDIAVSCYVKYFNKYNELHTLLYPFRLYYYLIKDVLGVNDEPFSAVPPLTDGDDQHYGTGMVRWLHQSKNMVRFVGQDLLIGSLTSV